jgi:hypothetical protein
MAPRLFVVVLAGFLTLTLTALLLRRPFSTPSFSYPGVFGPGHYLASWLLEEEAGYSAFLLQRQQDVETVGPNYIS